MTTLWWVIAAYLVGTIPFGLLIGLMKGVDIRRHGSGNIGATNAGRVLGRKVGMVCFSLDVAKGLAPTLAFGFATGIAGRWSLPTDQWRGWLLVAIAAVLGHIFPIWLKFKGGKGVATGLGVMLGVFPVLSTAVAGAVAVWIVSAKISRYVGLSSCLAALSLPVWTLLTGLLAAKSESSAGGIQWPCVAVTTAMAALVLWTHRANLKRVVAGTEPKIGHRKTEQT